MKDSSHAAAPEQSELPHNSDPADVATLRIIPKRKSMRAVRVRYDDTSEATTSSRLETKSPLIPKGCRNPITSYPPSGNIDCVGR